MLGGCRNDNITRSALYIHEFHYSVTMPVVMGYFNITRCGHTHTQCTTGLHLECGVFSTHIMKVGLQTQLQYPVYRSLV